MGHLAIDRALTIDGWMSQRELEWLADRASVSDSIIEIGSYHGRSTRAIADNTFGKVTAVDPWDCNYYDYEGKHIYTVTHKDYEIFRVNMEGVLADLTIFKGEFEDLPNEIKAKFIFIDGKHQYEHIKADITKALFHIERPGIIAGHDYASYWPSVISVVDKFFPDKQVSDTIWWTVLT